MFILVIMNYSHLTYNRDYHYPLWAIGIGWAMACASVIMIPIVMIVKFIKAEGTLYKVLAVPCNSAIYMCTLNI